MPGKYQELEDATASVETARSEYDECRQRREAMEEEFQGARKRLGDATERYFAAQKKLTPNVLDSFADR